MRIPSAAINRYVSFVAVDATDLKTRETTMTLGNFVVYYYLDDGTATVMTTPTVQEPDATNMPGVYRLLIDESGMTTLDSGKDTMELALHIDDSGGVMAPVTRVIEIYRPETTEGNTLGVAATGDVSGNVDGNVDGSVASVTGAVGSVTGAVGSVAAGGITSTSIATGAIDADSLATDAVDEIADGVWDEPKAGHVGATTFGDLAADLDLVLEDTGTTIPGTITTLQGDTDDIQTRLPAALVGGAMDADVSAIQTGAVSNLAIASGALDASKLAAGTIGASQIAANAIGSTELADGAITANKIAADAINETKVAAAVHAEAADAVWDEPKAGHVGPTTFGDLPVDLDLVLADTADMQPKLGSPAVDLAADIDAVRDAVEIASGTAQAVTATTIQLAAAETFANDELNGQMVTIVSATLGAGQSRMITDYVGATDTATVNTWDTTPTGTITYVVTPGPGAQEIAEKILPKKNVAYSFYVMMVLASDNQTPATGLTVTGMKSIDGAGEVAVVGSITEIGTTGYYEVDGTAADMNGDFIAFRFSSGTAADTIEYVRTAR